MMEQELIHLEAEGHQLAAIAGNRSSSAPPIVFLHGVTLSFNMWPPSIPEEIRQNFPWYSLTLPGHYPAVAPEDFGEHSVTPEMFASVLGSAIEQLVGNRPVLLVGYSMGAFAALILGALRPKQVQSILCISGFSRGQWSGLLGHLQMLASGPSLSKMLFKKILKFGTSRQKRYWFASSLNAVDRSLYMGTPESMKIALEPLRLDADRHNHDHICNFFSSLANMDIEPLLKQISASTTVVVGEKDPLIPSREALTLKRCLPNVKLVMLSNIGHMFFVECTEYYQEILVDWAIARAAIAN